jgi:conjugative relaxase-like TrwC/TraI family protein
MLKISEVQSIDYYTRKAAGCGDDPLDYYLGRQEAPGRWAGTGAEQLGLTGGLSRETAEGAFKRLIEDGVLPGQSVRASKLEHDVGGFDLTISAPKSLSVVAAIGDPADAAAARDAHEAGVAAALSYLEDETSMVRRGKGGQRYEPSVPGLIGVGFRHREARPCQGCGHGDPQVHTHVVVANLARASSDDEWLSLDSHLMHNHAKTAGCIYQAVMRQALTERTGYQWKPVHNGLAELAGVKTDWLRLFSKRTRAIDEYTAERGIIDASPADMEAAVLATRQRKGPAVEAIELRQLWAEEAKGIGLDTGALSAGLEHGAKGTRRSREWKDTAERLMRLDGLTRDESSFTRQAVVRTAAEEPGTTPVEINARVDELLARAEVVPVLFHRDPVTGKQMRGQDSREPRYTTMAQLELEQRVLDSAVRRQRGGFAVVPEHLVSAALTSGLVTLGDDQEAAVRALLRDGNGVSILVAAAGTGKTTALGVATAAWKSAGVKVVGCAAGGKAAGELAKRTGMSTSTIARTFADITRGVGLPAGGVLVVDEAGMVGTRDLERLLTKAEHAQTKVVLVGDPAQLQPVASGGIMRALVTRCGAERLTVNRRQRDLWQREALTLICEGHGVEGLDRFVTEGRVTVAETPMAARAACVADYWRAARDSPTETIMVTKSNTDVESLNRLAQSVARATGRLSGPVVANDFVEIQAGDRVICRDTTQGRRYGVHNGDLGTCAAVQDGGRLVLDLDKGGRVELPPSYMPKVGLGYALTVHRAQGSTVDHVFVYGDGARELAYTALSRHRVDCRVYLSSGADDRAEIDLPKRAQVDAIVAAKRAVSSSCAKLAAVGIVPKTLREEELRTEIGRTEDLLRGRPRIGVAVPVARAEVEHLRADIAVERERVERTPSASRTGLLRQGTATTTLRSPGALERLTARLEVAEDRLTEAERAVGTRRTWDDEHLPELARGVAAGEELGWRQQALGVARDIEAPAVQRDTPKITLDAPGRSHSVGSG